jgi:quercetin dioxygenase-like cupin family protein
MQILPKPQSVKGPEDMFTGDVWLDLIVKGDAPSQVRASTVRFAPGARTAWHTHAVGQTLYVTEGLGLVQSRGGEILELRPGDVVWTPPGEWHWHGATAGNFMAHIAIWEGFGQGDETEWGELVTDAEYAAQAG